MVFLGRGVISRGRFLQGGYLRLPIFSILKCHYGTVHYFNPNLYIVCIYDLLQIQGYVPLTLDVMRVAFKVPLAFHTPL